MSETSKKDLEVEQQNEENEHNLDETPEKKIDPEEEERIKAEKEFQELVGANLSEFKLLKDYGKWAMTKLDLKDKGLKKLHPSVLEYASILDLDLSNNEFEDLENTEYIPNLNFLNFANNKLLELKLNSQGLSALSWLDLSGNQLATLPDFKFAPELKFLNLTGNQIEQVKGFSGHPTLEHLKLAANKLSHLDHISNLPNLIYLDVSRNQLNYFGVFEGHYNTLVNTSNIRVLRASENPFSERVICGFKLPNLAYLELKDCPGNLEAFMYFFVQNRQYLSKIKEMDVANVEELEKQASADDVEFKQLLLGLVPNIEILNNEVVTNKQRQEALIISEKWADEYAKLLHSELTGEKPKDGEEDKLDDE